MPESVPLPLRGELENVRQLERQVQSLAKKASKNLKIDFGSGKKNIESLSQPLGRITGKADEFTKSMEAANARVIAFGASVGILSAVTQSFKALVSTTIEVEQKLASINAILNTNVSGLEKLKGQIFDIARNTEQTFDTVAEAALELSRQGLSASEVTKRLNDSLILARLSGVGAAEAVGSLTAAVNGFSASGLTTSEILNKVSAAANKFAVSERDLFEGFKRSASVAQQAGVSLDELGGIITAVQQKTARGGAVIGNSFKTIFTRIGRSENLNLLESVGVQITDLQGNILPATKLIEGLAQQLSSLDDVQVRSITEKIGGGFQIAPLLAALQDYSSENSVAIQATEAFANATDEAYRKNIALNQTLSAAIQSTSLTVKELANTLGELGITDVFGTLLSSVQSLISNITDLLQGDGLGSTFARGFVKGVSGLILPAIGLVLVIIGKLSKDLIKFGIDSLKTFLGLGNAAERLKSVEQKTFQVLLNNEAVRKQILAIENSSITVEQKRLLQSELFTKSLLGQRTLLQELQQISARVAPGIIAGVGAGKSRVGRSAGGFLPVGAEKSDISRGVGGAPSSAKPVVIPNFAFGGGQKGTMVANSSEYIVPNFAGGGSAIFNQDMVKSMGLPSGAKKINAAGGFIPNFAFGNSYSLDRIENRSTPSDFYSKGVLKDSARNFIDKNPKDPRAAAILAKDPKKKAAGQLDLSVNGRRYGIASIGTDLKAGNETPFDIAPKPLSSFASSSSLSSSTAKALIEQGYNTISFRKVQVKSLQENELQNAVEKNRNRLFDYFLQPLASYGKDLLGSSGLFKGNDLNDATKLIDTKNNKKLFSKGAEGGIFESAVDLITKGISGLPSIGDSETSPFDFEETGSASSGLKKAFGFSNALKKADAKRTASTTTVGSVVGKALRDGEESSYIKSLAKRRLKSVAKKASTGYIPNFAMSPIDDAIQREKDAGVPVNQIRINQSGKLRSSQNPNGVAVTNTRDEPTGRIPQTAARGFVPNFVGTFMADSARKANKNSNNSNGGNSDNGEAASDASGRLFALSTAAFVLQGAFSSVGEEATGASKTMSELAAGASKAVTTLLLLQGFGVKLGRGQGFIPEKTPSLGLGEDGKIGKIFGVLGKVLPGLGKGFGFFAKLLPRLIPGVGQAVIAFQILSPIIKSLANKFKPLGNALDYFKDKLLEFAGLIPGIDSPQEREAKKRAKESKTDLSKILTNKEFGKNIFAGKNRRADEIRRGVADENTGTDQAGKDQVLVNSIEREISRISPTAETSDTVNGIIATFSEFQRSTLADDPGSLERLINQQLSKLPQDKQGQFGKVTDAISEKKAQLKSEKRPESRTRIKQELIEQEKIRESLVDLLLKEAKVAEETEQIEIRKISTLKAIDDLRRSAFLSASKALIGTTSELEFQLKLQNSLKQTSDLTKSSSERQLRSIDQEKKKRIELLDVFDASVTQNKELQVSALPGGKLIKDSDIKRRDDALASARFQVQETGTFDENQLRSELENSGLVKGNLEDIIKLAKESFKIRSAEINAQNAEINIQKENLKLIKLAVQEEKNRETITQRILDLKGEELSRQRTSAEIQRDLDISNIKLKGGSIQSEGQAFAQEKAINNVNKNFTRNDFERQRGLAQETLLKDVINTLKDQGVNVDRATQGSLRESLQGEGGSLGSFKQAADKLVTDLNTERKQEKTDAIQAKIEAKESLLQNIRLNQNISNKNRDAADIQLQAAKLNLQASDPAAAANENSFGSLTLSELREKLSKIQSDTLSKRDELGRLSGEFGPGKETDEQIKLIKANNELESTIQAFIKIRASNATVVFDKTLEKSVKAGLTGLKEDLAAAKKETGSGATGIDSFTSSLKDYEAKRAGLEKLERIALNDFELAIRDASGGLTIFGNLLLKEIANSEPRRQQALFQAKTSTDPSQILSGLIGARRESVLQSSGSVAEANESQLLLEKKLTLIEATSTAQRIQAEEEYNINLQILKIRSTINKSSTPDEIEAAVKRIKTLLAEPDTLGQGLVKALAVDGTQASLNIRNTLIDGAVQFKDTLIDGILEATQRGGDLKDILLGAATEFLNKIARTQLDNAFGGIADAIGIVTGSIKKRASGGMINGGSGTKDDVPALLMGGEYVVRKSAVEKYGPSFMDQINGGKIEKFASGGLVGGNFADIYGRPFEANTRNRFESSSAYGNPLESGKLAVQTGQGGFFGPGIRGGGAIKGADDLIAFAGQGFTQGLSDTKRFSSARGGGAASIDLEPESVRLTNFGRSRGAPLQRLTQESKGQAFDAFTKENSERTRLKLEEKQRKKERKDAFKNAIIGAVVSTVFGAIAQSATAGFQNKFAETRVQGGGAGNLLKSIGSGLKGVFTGGEIKGLDGNFGGLVNIFSEKGNLTTTNLSSFFEKNPTSKIADQYIANNPNSPLAKEVINNRLLSTSLGENASFSSSALSREARNNAKEITISRATGGYVPSTAGIDNVPTMLSGGEFVMNSAATQRIGQGNLENLNAGFQEAQTENSEELLDKIQELIDINKESGGGSGDISITVNSTSSGASSGESEESSDGTSKKDQELARKIKDQVLQVINEEKRLGGTLRRI